MSAPRRRLPHAAALAMLALGLLLAPAAAASDTFVLDNQSKVATLTGTSLWGKGNTMNAGCRTGPFPGPTLTAFTFNPGDKGSITLTRNPFSKCLPAINPLVDNPMTSPNITNGLWTWIPDDPFIGYASLTCDLYQDYVSQPVEWSVDGRTCTISDPSSQPSGAFASSAAPVRGGNAVAYVRHSPGSNPGTPESQAELGKGLYEIVLRKPEGGVHGRAKATIAFGRSRKVRIPISRALREQVAEMGSVKVKAILRRKDGKPGSGDRTALRVMKDRKSLPF